MCLYIKSKKDNSHIKTAKRNIVVYKVFRIPFSYPDKLISPFMDKKYNIGKTYYIKNSTIEKCWSNKKCRRKTTINEGIHSFRRFKDATSLENVFRSLGNMVVTYQCVIPAGSKYVLGTDSMGSTKEIVSSKIKILKKCVY